jgi:cell division protein FtsL
MTRLSLFCAVLLMASALSLVSSQYRARQLFIDLDQARAASRKLDIEWRTLQLDQTNYSKNSLIEATAERDLKMRRPTPARMQFLALPEHATARELPSAGIAKKDAP